MTFYLGRPIANLSGYIKIAFIAKAYKMERIEIIDREIRKCIELLDYLTRTSSELESPNLAMTMSYVIREMNTYNEEKIQLLNRQLNITPVAFRTPFQTTLHFPIPGGNTFSLDDDPDEEPEEDGPLRLSELYVNDENETPDGGPLQLADLMEQAQAFVGDQEDEDEVMDNEVMDNEDGDQRNYPSDMEENIELGPHITIRRRTTRPIQSMKCERRYIEKTETELEQPNKESCHVCMETPLKRDACKTGCKHHYCRDCFGKWENQTRIPTCPTCRNERPVVYEYIL